MVIKDFRQIEETAFSLKAWFAELKYILKEALKAFFFPLLLLFFGLIPIVGLPLVIIHFRININLTGCLHKRPSRWILRGVNP